MRGSICGLMTTTGGIGHTLPFLIGNFYVAIAVAVAIVAVELAVIAWIRHRYMDTPLLSAAFQVIVGGVSSSSPASSSAWCGCGCGESNSDFSLGKAARYLYATPAEKFIRAANWPVQAWALIFSIRTFLAAVPTTCSRTVPPLKKRRVGIL
jgi:hypothetical protein